MSCGKLKGKEQGGAGVRDVKVKVEMSDGFESIGKPYMAIGPMKGDEGNIGVVFREGMTPSQMINFLIFSAVMAMKTCGINDDDLMSDIVAGALARAVDAIEDDDDEDEAGHTDSPRGEDMDGYWRPEDVKEKPDDGKDA